MNVQGNNLKTKQSLKENQMKEQRCKDKKLNVQGNIPREKKYKEKQMIVERRKDIRNSHLRKYYQNKTNQ